MVPLSAHQQQCAINPPHRLSTDGLSAIGQLIEDPCKLMWSQKRPSGQKESNFLIGAPHETL